MSGARNDDALTGEVPTWTGSVRWADAADPEAWKPRTQVLPVVPEPESEERGSAEGSGDSDGFDGSRGYEDSRGRSAGAAVSGADAADEGGGQAANAAAYAPDGAHAAHERARETGAREMPAQAAGPGIRSVGSPAAGADAPAETAPAGTAPAASGPAEIGGAASGDGAVRATGAEAVSSRPDSASSAGSPVSPGSGAASSRYGEGDPAGQASDTAPSDAVPSAEDEPEPVSHEPSSWSVRGENGADLYEEAAAREADEVADTVYELRSAAQRLEELLIGGKRVLTRKEVAQLAEVSTLSARKLWRALGQPLIPEREVAYTVKDAEAVRSIADLVSSGRVDEETAMQFARGVGQMTDRLVVWQMEAMVEYLTEEKGLSDSEARRAVLDVFAELIDPLEGLMVYAWRRNLAGVLSRLNVNVEDSLEIGGVERGQDATMPLARAIGFIDLVSYTRLSQQLDSRELSRLVKHFQFLAYNIVAAGGGRVIKTVGDEVFFSTETPQAGAEIAMTLLEQVKADDSLPQCRVGFSWGRVLSRMGDIFGTTVNLAARLTAVADPGTVVTDTDTARIIERDRSFEFTGRRDLPLQGLGDVGVVEMHRLSAGTIATEDIID